MSPEMRNVQEPSTKTIGHWYHWCPLLHILHRVLFSAEGVEVVHLCFLGQNAPANVGARDFEDDLLYTLIAARPSAITEPTLTPVDEWYGA